MNALRRFAWYYRTYGAASTCRRLAESARRSVHLGRMVLFVCPLPNDQWGVSPEIAVTRVEREELLAPADRTRLLTVGDAGTIAEDMRRRFATGAELWLAKEANELVAFGWTMVGQTVVPHYFPFDAADAHLFDFFVFPAFRGRAINVALLHATLNELANRGIRRAHLECSAWNRPQLRSLRKTPFTAYAEATKCAAFGQTFVWWHRSGAAEQRGRRSPVRAVESAETLTASPNTSAKIT